MIFRVRVTAVGGEKGRGRSESDLALAVRSRSKRASAVGPPLAQVLTLRQWSGFLSKFFWLETEYCLCLLWGEALLDSYPCLHPHHQGSGL